MTADSLSWNCYPMLMHAGGRCSGGCAILLLLLLLHGWTTALESWFLKLSPHERWLRLSLEKPTLEPSLPYSLADSVVRFSTRQPLYQQMCVQRYMTTEDLSAWQVHASKQSPPGNSKQVDCKKKKTMENQTSLKHPLPPPPKKALCGLMPETCNVISLALLILCKCSPSRLGRGNKQWIIQYHAFVEVHVYCNFWNPPLIKSTNLALIVSSPVLFLCFFTRSPWSQTLWALLHNGCDPEVHTSTTLALTHVSLSLGEILIYCPQRTPKLSFRFSKLKEH